MFVCFWFGEPIKLEKERERERVTDRQTDRNRDRQLQRQTDRDKHKWRYMDRQTREGWGRD